MRNPGGSTGWIIVHNAEGLPIFAGTCFGFRQPHFLLTAAHCIGSLDLRSISIGIASGTVSRGIDVYRIERHPAADLALIEILNVDMPLFDYFHDIEPHAEWGAELMAFGYPEDSGDSMVRPTPRFFRGHVQRKFWRSSHLKYEYDAIELNFSAPAGLSGGPVALAGNPGCVVGVVTENVRSSTLLESVEEETAPGYSVRNEIHAVVNYGVAVSLAEHTEWLNDVAPRPS